MEEMTHAAVVAALLDRGTPRDLAVQYADSFVEYREASSNISANGAIVQHPRTNNPIENPYLKVRDRALARLRKMRAVKAEFLW